LTKIVEDFVGNEASAPTYNRLAKIARYWGYNSFPMSRAQFRANMNAIMPAPAQIANNERASSFRTKLNTYHNDPEIALASIFGAPSVLYNNDLALMFTDTAGTVLTAAVGDTIAHIKPTIGSINSVQSNAALRARRSVQPASGVRNLFTESEFRNGVSDANIAGLVSVASMVDCEGALYIQRDVGTTSAAKVNMLNILGVTQTISIEVEMDDGLAPSFGSNTATSVLNDFVFLFANAATAPLTYVVTPVAGYTGRFTVSLTTQNSTNNTVFSIVKYAANSARNFKTSRWQREVGAATAYQRVRTIADVSEAGQAAIVGFLPDNIDDAFVIGPFAAGITGDMIIAGVNGCWIEPVSIGAGASLTIGGSRMNIGTLDGITGAVGQIIGFAIVNRTLNATERQLVSRYFRGRGAKGLLNAGADLTLNGDFASATGWTIGTDMAIAGGRLALNDGTTDQVAYNSGATPANRSGIYLIESNVFSDTSNGGFRQGLYNASTGVRVATINEGFQVGTGVKRIATRPYLSLAQDVVAGVQYLGARTGAISIESLSLKLLTAEV
jgi:hypothetical protein